MAWWQHAVFYEVYLRSFAGGNGDGLGELAGLRSRLPYLNGLGVDAVWITPFYPTPDFDHGYDVAEYCDVDPRFGTLSQFDELVGDAHALGLRVLVDLVPNHTSSRHPWFVDARRDPHHPHRERYVWAAGREGPGRHAAPPGSPGDGVPVPGRGARSRTGARARRGAPGPGVPPGHRGRPRRVPGTVAVVGDGRAGLRLHDRAAVAPDASGVGEVVRRGPGG
ncbi:MAG TPA: alpha-amylase family glycosyl hydrolase [Acidimicrobiales bacterium]|nr:alpha-amylase family glycosyl hydrolase [Acidimicrobiales bacterium]